MAKVRTVFPYVMAACAALTVAFLSVYLVVTMAVPLGSSEDGSIKELEIEDSTFDEVSGTYIIVTNDDGPRQHRFIVVPVSKLKFESQNDGRDALFVRFSYVPESRHHPERVTMIVQQESDIPLFEKWRLNNQKRHEEYWSRR